MICTPPPSNPHPRSARDVGGRVLAPRTLARGVIGLAAIVACTAVVDNSWAQPPKESVLGAEMYLNRKFGKVPLEEVNPDILKEFAPPSPPLEKVTEEVLKEFSDPAAQPPATAVSPQLGPALRAPTAAAEPPAQAAVTNIYGVPEGEIAVEAAAEVSAATGPGVAFSLIQPGWIQRGDVSRVDLRIGPADTHASLYYDVPSDFMGAQWMSAVFDYKLSTPAYKVEDSPKYRSGLVSFTWQAPFSNEWIGDWQSYWGIRIENKEISINTPELVDFYRQYAGKSSYVVPNAGLTRIKRASQHPLSEGKSESVHFETSLAGSGSRYWKTEYRRDQYWEMDNKLVFNLNAAIGYAKPLGDGTFPLTQRFLAIGKDAVRGYASGTIGPTDPGNNAIGGLRKLSLSGEAYLQAGTLLGQPLHVSAFADAARLDRSDVGQDAKRNYVGFGLGLTWRAPAGLVKFNFARPVNPLPTDRLQQFTFEFKTMLR